MLHEKIQPLFDFGFNVRLTEALYFRYPDELAWQIDFTKKEIRNDSTLKTLHGFLVSETESVCRYL